jgi:hypothetical protein
MLDPIQTRWASLTSPHVLAVVAAGLADHRTDIRQNNLQENYRDRLKMGQGLALYAG